jgi:hypothetical protein
VRFGLCGEEAGFALAWRRASRTRVEGAKQAPEHVCMAARAGARTLGSSMAAWATVDGELEVSRNVAWTGMRGLAFSARGLVTA